MDKKTIIPEDKELCDKLFNAGLDMLVDAGVYCIDTGRVIKYTRDEVLQAIENAPDHFQFGEGKEAHNVTPRSYKDSTAPIIQGGPTGSPCSEELFLPIHQAYARSCACWRRRRRPSPTRWAAARSSRVSQLPRAPAPTCSPPWKRA